MAKIIISLLIQFVLRQLEKWLETIDWQKVAEDFIERLRRLLPRRAFTPGTQQVCRDYVRDLARRFEEKNVMAHYGKSSWDGAVKDWIGHGSQEVYREAIQLAMFHGPEASAGPEDPFEETEVIADGHGYQEVPKRRGRKPRE